MNIDYKIINMVKNEFEKTVNILFTHLNISVIISDMTTHFAIERKPSTIAGHFFDIVGYYLEVFDDCPHVERTGTCCQYALPS